MAIVIQSAQEAHDKLNRLFIIDCNCLDEVIHASSPINQILQDRLKGKCKYYFSLEALLQKHAMATMDGTHKFDYNQLLVDRIDQLLQKQSMNDEPETSHILVVPWNQMSKNLTICGLAPLATGRLSIFNDGTTLSLGVFNEWFKDLFIPARGAALSRKRKWLSGILASDINTRFRNIETCLKQSGDALYFTPLNALNSPGDYQRFAVRKNDLKYHPEIGRVSVPVDFEPQYFYTRQGLNVTHPN